MPNIANVFKAEITRLTRKEIRKESAAHKKAATAHRAEIAALKRRVATLEAAVKALLKQQGARPAKRSPVADDSTETASAGHRFNAKGLAANRKRLGLSAADFGLLVGTTGQSIYAWEAEKSVPRPKALAAIASLRGIGKRAVAERLETLKA